MKVEKTNVHRLSVERECGCKAVREFKDPQYKDPIDEASFEPCKKHKAKGDLSDMMQMIMVEDVNREAESNARPTYAPLRVPDAVPTSLDGSAGETVTSTPITRRPRVAVAPAAGGGVPAPQSGPRRDPTQVRTVNRDHSGAGVGPRARIAGKMPVTGVTVRNPAAGGPRRPQTVQVGEVELATPGMDLDLDMDGVPEDPRVTALAENALLPDLEDDPTQA